MADAAGDLLGHDELWIAAAAALVLALILVHGGTRRADLALAPAVGIGAATAEVGSPVVLIVAFLVVLSQRAGQRASVTAVGGSMTAVVAAYACTPDTERSVVVLGAVAALAAVTLAFGLSWSPIAAGVTVLVGWIALTDGQPRSSAVIATLGIAALHLVHARIDPRLVSWPRWVALLPVGGAFAVLARSAGRGSGDLRPAAVTASVVLTATMGLLVLLAITPRGHAAAPPTTLTPAPARTG